MTSIKCQYTDKLSKLCLSFIKQALTKSQLRVNAVSETVGYIELEHVFCSLSNIY